MDKLVDSSYAETVPSVDDISYSVKLSDDITNQIGEKNSEPLVLGFAGGDAILNTNISSDISSDNSFIQIIIQRMLPNNTPKTVDIVRDGGVENTISSGNVLLGTGASTAVALGNAELNGSFGYSNINISVDVNAIGNNATNTTVALTGDVTTTVDGTANLGIFANGGTALGLGANATSTVGGSTILELNNYGEDSRIDGYALGVAGGGAAISTLGANAQSEVNGDTSIIVNNRLSGLVAGGGSAFSLDAVGLYSAFAGDKGNDNGTSDFEISDSMTVNLSQVNEGGNATVSTGDTNIELTGSSTSFAVMGGGIAGAFHSYAGRSEGDNKGYPLGSSTASSNSGKSTITVNLKPNADTLANGKKAVKQLISTVKDFNNLDLSELGKSLDGLGNQGLALGILGGGAAIAVGDANTNATSKFAGSEITLNSGYVVGTFGGGLATAVADKNGVTSFKDGESKHHQLTAKVEATGDTTINVNTADEYSKAIGVFGGGMALSAEASLRDSATDKDSVGSVEMASSSVKTSTINVNGKADGVFGGGIAIGNSNQANEEHVDALASVENSVINVGNGSVIENLNLQPLMEAVKNDNKDDYPWWSVLGYNASQTMVNLKGVTDRTAIAGGGLGLGMSALASTGTSEINVDGSTVTGDIVAGGIAVANLNESSGAKVDKSVITIGGDSQVEGSIYAGGAVNETNLLYTKGDDGGGYDTFKDAAKLAANVGSSTVNLTGAEVTGEISGQGYAATTNWNGNYNYFGTTGAPDYTYTLQTNADNSILNISGQNTFVALANDDAKAKLYTGDGAKIHHFNQVNVKAGSTTVLSGDFSSNPLIALNDDENLTVDGSAKLDFNDVTGDRAVIVKDLKPTDSVWQSSNFIYDRFADYVKVVDDTDNFIVSKTVLADADETVRSEAAADFTDFIGAPVLSEVIGDAYQKLWDPNKLNASAVEYFKDWNDAVANGQSSERYLRGALMGEDAAVTASSVAILRDVADTVTRRLSFTEDHIAAPGVIGPDGALWVKYLHKNFDSTLASSVGELDAKTNYNGVIVGADLARIGNFQGGVALHYGNGDSTGSISTNDFDAYGISVYGSYKDVELGYNLLADVGYTKTDNDVQGFVGKAGSADHDLSLWTVGVRGEKQFVFDNSQIVPYAGLRYILVDGSNYDSSFGFRYNVDSLNLWTLPIGVNLRHEFAFAEDWSVIPQVDLGYIFAFGDKDGSVEASIGGDASSTLDYDIVDDGAVRGSLSLEAQKGSFSALAGYTYQRGSDTKDNKWFVRGSWSF